MLKLNNKNIKSLFVGNTSIKKAYLGNTLVFNSNEPILPYDAEVEFLRSTGIEYIDTNVVPNQHTGMYLYAEITQVKDQYVMGTRPTSGNTRYSIGWSTTWYYAMGSTYSDTYPKIYNAKAASWFNWLDNGVYVCDAGSGTSGSITMPLMGFTVNTKIRLFGSSGTNASYSKACAKIFEAKISQGSDIIAHFIPVRVGSVGYMYDKIGGRLYGNNGTGSFYVGPDK